MHWLVGDYQAISDVEQSRPRRSQQSFRIMVIALFTLLALILFHSLNSRLDSLTQTDSEDDYQAPPVVSSPQDEVAPLQPGVITKQANDAEEINMADKKENPLPLRTTRTYKSLKRRHACPTSCSVVRFLFPHVNKAGGRTIEGTFQIRNPKSAFRFLSTEKRSPRFQFELIDGHRDFDEVKRYHTKIEPIRNLSKTCVRWIFMMRDPIARTLSAFNTKVGREDSSTQATLPLGDHFQCQSKQITNLMKNPNFTFEEFAKLPAKERSTDRKSVV